MSARAPRWGSAPCGSPRHDRPGGTYPRRILLAVTGLSPQIVTETLYALAVERTAAWVPNRDPHHHDAAGRAEGAAHVAYRRIPAGFTGSAPITACPAIAFGAEDIHVITGPERHAARRHPRRGRQRRGRGLHHRRGAHADRRPERQPPRLDRRWAQDDGVLRRLRAVVVRARAGPALACAGRRSFESQTALLLSCAPGADGCPRAIWAISPLFGCATGSPERLLEGARRFSETVAEAQKALPPLALDLDPTTRTVTAGGETIALKPAQFAFYWMMAQRRQQRLRAACIGATRAFRRKCSDPIALVVNPDSGDYARLNAPA